jgi:O-methyltransferase involved in polyketide biosynthesis
MMEGMSLSGDPWRAKELKALVESSTSKPSEARVYDYWLGGACNWAVDRQFGDEAIKNYPDMPMIAQENRKFLYRAVSHLLRRGIRQFVDIGSGLPTAGNVHQIAERENPGQARVVYVDHDPIAYAHSAILLDEEGDPDRHRALCVDLVDYAELWRQVLDTGVIDPAEPIGLLMVAVLHFVKPDRHPEEAVAFYRNQLPSGSFLVITHGSTEGQSTETMAEADKVRSAYEEKGTSAGWFRSRAEIETFFGGWPIIGPGITWTATWSDGVLPTDYTGDPARAFILAGIAEKP